MLQRLAPLTRTLTILALLVAAPASAQYMYLDANGDGVSTPADVLNPTGSTMLDVWLRTDTNRDGTAASCATGEQFSIISYEFILRASNGRVNWLAFTNLQPTMLVSFGLETSATEYRNGFGGGTILAPGTYRLGTLEVIPAIGTPALAIVAASNSLPGSPFTTFGSQCLGQDLDNTLKLGLDWFDVDGVEYGGTPQAVPVLAPILDMTVGESQTAEQIIAASDADNQPLEFVKISGPAFMGVITTNPGAGTAEGKITLTPGPRAAVSTTGTVRVSDGLASDEQTFGITVVQTNDMPEIATASEISLGAPGSLESGVLVSDPDGGPISLSVVANPEFVPSFLIGIPSGGGISPLFGRYRVQPALADVGRRYLVLEASDGTSTAWTRVQIDVTGPEPGAAPHPDLFSASYTALDAVAPLTSVAAGDLNGDGIADLALASERNGTVDVCIGDGAGNYSVQARLLGQKTPAVVIGDFNRDGLGDVAFVDTRTNELVVARGPFTGGTPGTHRIAVEGSPTGLAQDDLNGDGWPDVAVSCAGGAGVSILLNLGDGTLGPPENYSAGPNAMSVALGDLTGDGSPDVVVTRRNPHALDVLANSGIGVLQPRVTWTSQQQITGVTLGRFNDDRMADVAVARMFNGFAILISTGGGAFSPGASYPGASVVSLLAADMNRDGVLDVLASGEGSGLEIRFGSGDGAFGDAISYPAPRAITSMVSLDADRDGDLDLVAGAARGGVFSSISLGIAGALAVYRNQGNGVLGSEWASSFPSVTGRPVLTDLNHDGHLDIAGANGVHLGLGDGTFSGTIPGVGANFGDFPEAMIAADMNRDGHQDLIGGLGVSNIGVWLGDGTGSFPPSSLRTIATNLQSRLRFAVGDVNADGTPDLVAGSTFYGLSGGGPILLWIGIGDGTFGSPIPLPSSAASAHAISIRDLDGDGHQDIVAADFYTSAIFALSGNGDGSFGETRRVLYSGLDATFGSPTGIGWGDMNEDGLPDCIAAAYQAAHPIGVCLQRANRSFASLLRVWALGQYSTGVRENLQLADFNGDGHLDLATITHGSIAVVLGDGLGSIGKPRYYSSSEGEVFAGDVNGDGRPDLVLAGGGYPSGGTPTTGPVRVLLNQSGLLDLRSARAFLTHGQRTVPIGGRGNDLCVRIEPVDGSYENADLDLSSIVMRSEGTGAIDEIAAIPPRNPDKHGKNGADGRKPEARDSDRNGIAEIEACFSSSNLARLFSNLRGRQRVTVDLEGALVAGGRIHAELTLNIVPTGSRCVPTLTPNPLNPTATFQFETTRDGQANIRLFDVQGRLVRALLNSRLAAGDQEVFFDGTDQHGRALSSGVYFASIETVDGAFKLRLVILK